MIICNAFESIKQLSTYCGALQAGSGPHGILNAAAVALGEMIHIPCDAYVVPCHGSFADFGNVEVTPSVGGNSRYFINAVTLGIPIEETIEAQKIVTLASRNALHQARKNKFERIIFPTLGTGPFGKLTAKQSAKAIFGALYAFWDMAPDEGPYQVIVAIPNDRSVYNSFCEILLKKSMIKKSTS